MPCYCYAAAQSKKKKKKREKGLRKSQRLEIPLNDSVKGFAES